MKFLGEFGAQKNPAWLTIRPLSDPHSTLFSTKRYPCVYSGPDLAATWDSGPLGLWLTQLFVHLRSPWWALGPAGSLFVPEIQVVTANTTSSMDSPQVGNAVTEQFLQNLESPGELPCLRGM